MGGLALQEEQHRPPPPCVGGNSREVGENSNHSNSTSSNSAQDAPATAVVGGGLAPTPPLLHTPLVLPTATPERRRLAPTEFITLSSSTFAVSPPNDTDGGGIRNLPARVGGPDAVMAKLVRDFDIDDEENGNACSPTPPKDVCSSSNSSCGDDSVDGDEPASISSLVVTEGGGDRSRPATANSSVTVESSTEGKQGKGAPRRWNNKKCHPSSALGSSAAHGGGESGKVLEGLHEDGARHDAGHDGGGDGDDGGDSLKEEAGRSTRSKTEEEVDVPDGEWRRYWEVEKETYRRYCSGLGGREDEICAGYAIFLPTVVYAWLCVLLDRERSPNLGPSKKDF